MLVAEGITALAVAGTEVAVVAAPIAIVGGTVMLVVMVGPEAISSLDSPEPSLSGTSNPWTGGWTETYPLGAGTISGTRPLGETRGAGEVPSWEQPGFSLGNEQDTFGLDFPLERPSVLGDNVVDSTIYRGGGTNPGNLTPRPQDNGELSFRGSLSNPWPLPTGQRPPLPAGKPYFGVDTSKLPPGSVIYDDIPPGHVSVKDLPSEVVKDAIIEKGQFPK